MTETRELSAENIFSADDMKVESVDVPEWGGKIYVRRLTGRERDEFEQLMNDRRAGKILKVRGVITKIVALAACTSDGSKLFTSDKAESKLDEKACAPLMRVFDAALKISGMRDDDIQNLTEGLEASPSGPSGSA